MEGYSFRFEVKGLSMYVTCQSAIDDSNSNSNSNNISH